MNDNSSSPIILEAKNITLRFGGLTAVKNVSFNVKKGEILSIIGPNGAGKTSLFNSLTGIYEPTIGSIEIDNFHFSKKLSIQELIISALLSAAITLLTIAAIYISPIWESSIQNLYVYNQTFDWFQSILVIPSVLFSDGYLKISILGFLIFLLTLTAVISIKREFCISPQRANQLGLARTFQNIRLFSRLSVLDNVLLAIADQKRSSILLGLFFPWLEDRYCTESRLKAEKLLKYVSLYDQKNSSSNSLSYGARRRLEIARALATNPKILLLDEPAAGLNPTEGKELSELIISIKLSGVTVILIEHHMKVVMSISDRIIVLNNGEKLAEGSPSEIRDNHAVIEAYLGGILAG